MNHKSRKIYYAAAALLWILIWQVAVTYVNRRLLIPIPTPVSTAAALIRLSADRSFFHAVFLSILRITVGFLSAFAVGTLLAVLSVKSEFVHVLTAPLLQLIRAIPVASFTILVFLWVTRERIPSVISFFTVLPVIWANVESGLRAADEGLVEMARVFGLPGGRILREILLPSIRPYIASAAANGIGFAWKSGVAAEVICRTQDSLGNLLWQGKSTVEYDEVFAVTLVIVALSILLQWAASLLLRGRLGAQGAARRSDERAEGGASAGLQQGTILRSAERAEAGALAGLPQQEAILRSAERAEADASAGLPQQGAVRRPAESAADDSSLGQPQQGAVHRSAGSAGDGSPLPARTVALERVSFYYDRRKPLVKDLSLQLAPGSRRVVTGASGAGKTTLLRLVMGLTRPKSGTVTRPEDLRISPVFQEDRLIPWKNVFDNVTFFADGEEEKARQLLTELGLGDSMSLLPEELSGGMKRRAALARALTHPFDLLVLDEAFTGLDRETKAQCLAIADREIGGRMLLMASHDPAEAEALAAEKCSL